MYICNTNVARWTVSNKLMSKLLNEHTQLAATEELEHIRWHFLVKEMIVVTQAENMTLKFNKRYTAWPI